MEDIMSNNNAKPVPTAVKAAAPVNRDPVPVKDEVKVEVKNEEAETQTPATAPTSEAKPAPVEANKQEAPTTPEADDKINILKFMIDNLKDFEGDEQEVDQLHSHVLGKLKKAGKKDHPLYKGKNSVTSSERDAYLFAVKQAKAS